MVMNATVLQTVSHQRFHFAQTCSLFDSNGFEQFYADSVKCCKPFESSNVGLMPSEYSQLASCL